MRKSITLLFASDGFLTLGFFGAGAADGAVACEFATASSASFTASESAASLPDTSLSSFNPSRVSRVFLFLALFLSDCFGLVGKSSDTKLCHAASICMGSWDARCPDMPPRLSMTICTTGPACPANVLPAKAFLYSSWWAVAISLLCSLILSRITGSDSSSNASWSLVIIFPM